MTNKVGNFQAANLGFAYSPETIAHIPLGALVVPVPIVSTTLRICTWLSWNR